MDGKRIYKILTANPAFGPDTDQVLCAAVDKLPASERPVFVSAFFDALSKLLKDGTFTADERDLGLDCASHVLFHLDSLNLSQPIKEKLQGACIAWIQTHPIDVSMDWHARGSILRLLRLSGYREMPFWREEFEYWKVQLVEQPDKFIKVCRCLMQAVRAQGKAGLITSRDLAGLFAYGLRSKHFPAPEVYAALEEVCEHEKVTGPGVARNLHDGIHKLAQYAGSLYAMKQVIKAANKAQLESILVNWEKNCLGLNSGEIPREVIVLEFATRNLRVADYSCFELMSA